MRITEIEGDARSKMVPGLMHNRRMLEAWMRPCEDICMMCDDCAQSHKALTWILNLPDTRVFAILSDRNFYIGCMYFIDNDFHGTAFDGRLRDKEGVVQEAFQEILKDHDEILMHVPETTPLIANWAKTIGFQFDADLGPVWDDGDSMKNVERLVFNGLRG